MTLQKSNLKEGQALRLNSGQAMMVATMFFLVVSMTIIFGLVGPIVRQQKIVSQLLFSRQSYFLAEAGMEDVVYRLMTGEPVDASETLSLAGSSVTVVTTDTAEGKEIVATGEVQDTVRKVEAELIIGEGVAFHYGIQIGSGGFTLANNAGVHGNIHSNSSVIGLNGSFVTGSVSAVTSISGVVVGEIIEGVASGDANAPTVTNSTVRGKLYCQSGSGNNKPCDTSGVAPTATSFAITDEQINTWKADAELGGTVGTQALSGIDNVLGPTKIEGDLTIATNGLLRMTGTIWVTGNLILSNGAEIELDPSYGVGDGLIVVDGISTLSNNSNFRGSGESGSYVMLLSTNSGSNAILLQNNAGAAILYAPFGTVQVANNAGINQVTAKTVALQENAEIVYEQGIVEASFVNGPSGGYDILRWEEVE